MHVKGSQQRSPSKLGAATPPACDGHDPSFDAIAPRHQRSPDQDLHRILQDRCFLLITLFRFLYRNVSRGLSSGSSPLCYSAELDRMMNNPQSRQRPDSLAPPSHACRYGRAEMHRAVRPAQSQCPVSGSPCTAIRKLEHGNLLPDLTNGTRGQPSSRSSFPRPSRISTFIGSALAARARADGSTSHQRSLQLELKLITFSGSLQVFDEHCRYRESWKEVPWSRRRSLLRRTHEVAGCC